MVTISDDGTTMFALRSLGFDFSDRRNWRSLVLLADKHGFEITDAGEFFCTKPESELLDLSANTISLLAAICAWEKDRSSEGDADFSLTKEVEKLLVRNAPDRKITPAPIVQIGAADVAFDFLWGDIYVDAVRPIANAVNSRLRKGLLMQRIEAEGNILFIVDDTHTPDKARAEMAVLGGVAPAVSLSVFKAMTRRYENPVPT